MRHLPFPDNLQPDVDILVSAAHEKAHPLPLDAFERVTSWCEARDREDGLLSSGDYGEGFFVVWRGTTLPTCSDAESEWDGEVDPSELTDEDRVGYIKATFREFFDGELTGDEEPMAAFVPIRATSGKMACLGYFLTGGDGMGGPDVGWQGVYRSEKAFRAALRFDGGLSSLADVKKLSRSELLEFWER